jgi:RNA polymerase sigma-70 factor (ECF subfamily)
MDEIKLPDEMRDVLRASWHRYLDQVQPLRPQLHAYCRRLTRNLWDADDLVQESLLKAFGLLGHIENPIRNPRAYLLRIATNIWIDTLRRRERERALDPSDFATESDAADTGAKVRSAGAVLLHRLPPRERAALLLKDVFDMSLEETAEVLETTVGAVKSALHRGRTRLGEDADAGLDSRRAMPSRALVDQFVKCLQARDKVGLLALMQDNAAAENVGCTYQFGHEMHESGKSWFEGATSEHPDWPEWIRWEASRVECVEFEGEPIVLVFHTRKGQDYLEIVSRLEEEDGKIAALRSYGFCPEVIREIGEALGHKVNTGLYRYPTPAPGESYSA